MKRALLLIAVVVASAVSVFAHVKTDAELREFYKGFMASRPKDLPPMTIRLDGRTLVCDIENAEESVAASVTPAQLAQYYTDDIAAFLACNFISIKTNYHYVDSYGHKQVKSVTASPFDFLGISDNKYRTSLASNPKSRGVNIEVVEPRGWRKRESHNPYVLVNYMYGEGEDQVSFMIEIVELPTFISRNEATRIYHGETIYDLSMEGILGNMLDNIVDIKDDLIGVYPAVRMRLSSDVIIAGESRKIYTNCWFIIYEDRIVKLWGTAIKPTEFEKGLYDTMFQMLASQVRFPDQYQTGSYE